MKQKRSFEMKPLIMNVIYLNKLYWERKILLLKIYNCSY